AGGRAVLLAQPAAVRPRGRRRARLRRPGGGAGTRPQARRALRVPPGGAGAIREAPPVASRTGGVARAAPRPPPWDEDPGGADGGPAGNGRGYAPGPRARPRDDGGRSMTKYIFVTGGVVSSLGKGLASASIGALLEGHGFKVAMMKCDPYINVDP